MRYLEEQKSIMVEKRTDNGKKRAVKEGEEQKSSLHQRKYFVKI